MNIVVKTAINTTLFYYFKVTRPPSPASIAKANTWKRVMSRFASPKSEEARMEALADPSNFGDVDENDPKSIARFMKKMGKEMGEDMGEDFEEAMESMGEGGAGEDSMSLPDID